MTETSRRVRIIVADDHPALRYGIAATIEMQLDMALVDEAANGRQVIELFRNLRPDMALIDLQMPLMSGLDAIAAIRGKARHARINRHCYDSLPCCLDA